MHNQKRSGFFLLLTLVVVFSGACSRRSISVDDSSPPIFKLTGSNAVGGFKVSGKEGGEVWYFVVLGGDTTMSGIGTITYGVVPPCCSKDNPTNKPPALQEGSSYVAALEIYDADSEWVEFTIKNGKAVVSRTSAERYH